jgi:hypothetical protein
MNGRSTLERTFRGLRPTFCRLLFLLFICLASRGENHSLCPTNSQQAIPNKVNLNRDTPIYGEKRAVIERDLVIGDVRAGSPPTEYISDLEIDQQGRIFTLDSVNGTIKAYDPNGRFLKRFLGEPASRQGCSDSLDLEIGVSGNIYLLTLTDILIYTPEGRPINRISLNEGLSSFHVLSNDLILGTTSSGDGSQEVILLDVKGNRKKTVARFPGIRSMQIKDLKGVTHGIGPALYHPSTYCTSVDKNRVVYGHSDSCRLVIIDALGEQGLAIEKDEPPPPWAQGEKENLLLETERAFSVRGVHFRPGDLMKAMQFPDHKPYFNFLLSDGENIYAGRLKDKKGWAVDVFDKDGRYIYKFSMGLMDILKISKGYIFGLSPKSSSCIDRYRFRLE